MDGELEKIDVIRSRFNVSYEDARAALTSAKGDLVGALALIEKEDRADLVALGVDLAEEVQKLFARGPIKKLRVKYGGKLVTEKKVAFGAAAAFAVGIAAILLSKLMIEVDRGEEETCS